MVKGQLKWVYYFIIICGVLAAFRVFKSTKRGTSVELGQESRLRSKANVVTPIKSDSAKERLPSDSSTEPFIGQENSKDFMALRQSLIENGFNSQEFNSKLSEIIRSSPDGKNAIIEAVGLLPPKSRGIFTELVLKIIRQTKVSTNSTMPTSQNSKVDPNDLAERLGAASDEKIIHLPDGTYRLEKAKDH